MTRAAWVLGGLAGCGLSLLVLVPWSRTPSLVVESARSGELGAPARPVEGGDERLAPTSSPEVPRFEASESMGSELDAGLPAAVVPAGSDPRTDLDVVPHPHTAERRAFARQHALFDAVQQAIESGQFEVARDLLAEHERDFGGEADWRDRRVGFELVLDCLVHPGPESRARGGEFVARERLSPLRRRVRRTCLEGRSFGGRG